VKYVQETNFPPLFHLIPTTPHFPWSRACDHTDHGQAFIILFLQQEMHPLLQCFVSSAAVGHWEGVAPSREWALEVRGSCKEKAYGCRKHERVGGDGVRGRDSEMQAECLQCGLKLLRNIYRVYFSLWPTSFADLNSEVSAELVERFIRQGQLRFPPRIDVLFWRIYSLYGACLALKAPLLFPLNPTMDRAGGT